MSRRPPPGGEGRPVRILRIEPDEQAVVIFLGPYQGQIEHWERGRTFSCPGQDFCRTAHRKYRLDWYGYAPVAFQDPRTSRFDPWILQITANLEFRLRNRNLRGEIWLLSRAPNRGKRAELVGELIGCREPGSLPPAHALRPSLERIFGVDHVYLGQPNPHPEPLVVEHFEVAPFELPKPKVVESRLLTPEEIRAKLQLAKVGLFENGK